MLRAISMRLSRQHEARDAPACALLPSEEEWDALCRTQVFPYALCRLGQVQDAEDVTVETLEAALRNCARFSGAVEPRLWLLGIARRKIADAQRRRSRGIQPDASPEAQAEMWEVPMLAHDEPEATALRAEVGRELRALVWELPEPQREALLLQAVEGLSIAQIALVMNRSQSSANSLLGRARETLRRRGAEYFGGEA